jgi:DNA polymerase-3 subunit gamma/tau
LGVADAGLVLDATEALVEKDPRAALLTVQKLADSGRDYEQFMRDTAGHLRHLLVVQTIGEVPDSFAVTAEHTDRLASQAERLSHGELLRAVDLLAGALAAVKEGSEPRLQLEVALLKATQPQADQSLGALMFRIDQLEARLRGGAPAPSEHGDAGDDSAPQAAPAPQSEAELKSQSAQRGPSGSARAAVAVTAPAATGAATAVAAAVDPEAEPQPEAEVQPEPEAPDGIDLDRVTALWSSVADAVREQNAMVGALVSQAIPAALDGGRLTVAFPGDAAFLKKKAEANRDLVLSAVRSLTGHALNVAFELSDRGQAEGPRQLDEEELLERLKRDFAAEEVFDDDPDAED